MLCRLILDRRASSAAEFALVLPAALLLLFGIIDVGRYAWQLNEYEKATQMGARHAVMLDGGVSAQLLVRDAAGRAQTWKGMRSVPLALTGRPRVQ